jgi:catechol 2,3-dioxygenase-like lactoylglutathione lyase family enzyme
MGDSVGAAGIRHVAIVVDDAEKAFMFYRDVLGLTPVERPDFGALAGSFEAGGEQLHIMQPENPAMNPPHFAIQVGDLASAVVAIREQGVTVYEVDHVPGAGDQAFLRDPAGNVIELNEPDGAQA